MSRTPRRQILGRLRESSQNTQRTEDRFLWLGLPFALDALRTLVFLKDDKLRIVGANQAVLDLLGLSREAVIGRTATELTGVTGDCEKDDAEVLASGIAKTGVLHQFDLPDGTRWFLADKAPITAEDGTVTGVIGTLTDVTEQMGLHSAPQESEAQLKYITDNTADIIWTMDLNFRTTYVSPSVKRILGFTPEERCTQALEEMVTPSSRKVILETLRTELERESSGAAPDRSIVVEVEYYCKNGSTRWVENMVTPIRTADGTLTGMLGVSRDISELRQTRADLQKSEAEMRGLAAYLQDMRERERTDIARDLYDQIGQGLTALSLDLYILRQAIEKDSNASRQILNRIIAFVDGLTNDARTLSTELRPGMLDDLGLGPTVEWQVAQFEERSGLQCTFDLNCPEEDLPQRYSTALFRALQELLRNIMRHARARTVHVELGIRSGYVVLTVSDDGRGITPEEIRGPRSLGLLGLTEQIRLLGGSVDIVGTEGVGTVVSIRVPQHREHPTNNRSTD